MDFSQQAVAISLHPLSWICGNPNKSPTTSHPFHYTKRKHKQLQEMTKDGIIQPSNSPWYIATSPKFIFVWTLSSLITSLKELIPSTQG